MPTGRAIPSPVSAPEAGSLPIEQIRALWKHRWLILNGIAIALCLDALWVLRQPKEYAASTTIQFEPNPPRPLGRNVDEVDSSRASGYWNMREYYETQYRVARSRGVAEAVVRRLGLHRDPDFMDVPAARRRTWSSVSVTAAALRLIGRTRVEPVKDSRLMTITVEDTRPRRAQLLANTIAEVYIQRNLDQRMSGTRDAVRWLSNQLSDLTENLRRSEDALQRYKRENNIISEDFEAQWGRIGQRITRLSDELTATQARRIALSARVDELRRAGRLFNREHPLVQVAPELLQSTQLGRLREQYEQMRRDEEALAARYGEAAIPLATARARRLEVVDAMVAEVGNVVSSGEAELNAVRRAEAGLRAVLAQAQHEASALNEQEVAYQRLARERESHAKIYGVVLERTTESNLMRDLQVNNMRVLDPALEPWNPVKPRVAVSLMIAGVVGLVAGILAAMVAIQADRTVRSRADIEELLHTTFLGYLPNVGRRGLKNQYRYQYGNTGNEVEGPLEHVDLVVASHPKSMVAELARGIRTNLLFMSADTAFRTLMVTSATPQEGKTFTAISMAITLAQSGKRVLLVDADMRRPRVHKVFKMHPTVGLTSVLINEATVEEAVVQAEIPGTGTAIPNLFLLPCGPLPPNPAELLHSQRASEVFAMLQEKFDRVIFDSPPVTAVTDALVLGPQLDGVVLVTRAKKTRRDQAGVVLRQLRDLGSRVVGCVLNAVDLGSDAPDYYYRGEYNYAPLPADQPSSNA